MFHTIIIYLALLMAGAGSAWAASSNGNLSVSTVVPPQAIITGGILDFGMIPDPTMTLTANGIFQVSVSAGSAYHITLDAGLNNRDDDRRLSNGAGFFRPYRLYSNAAHTMQWGDAEYADTFDEGTAVSASGTGLQQTFTVYAVSPGQIRADNPPGNYTDTVTITVHY